MGPPRSFPWPVVRQRYSARRPRTKGRRPGRSDGQPDPADRGRGMACPTCGAGVRHPPLSSPLYIGAPVSLCGEEPPLIYHQKKGAKWRWQLEIFLQIFFHLLDTALHRVPDGALVHALLAGDLTVALSKDQVSVHPAALDLRQGIEGVSCRQAEYSIPSSQSRE